MSVPIQAAHMTAEVLKAMLVALGIKLVHAIADSRAVDIACQSIDDLVTWLQKFSTKQD